VVQLHMCVRVNVSVSVSECLCVCKYALICKNDGLRWIEVVGNTWGAPYV